MSLYLALLSSFDFTVAVFHLHYYGKQRAVKKCKKKFLTINPLIVKIRNPNQQLGKCILNFTAG